MTKFLEFLSEKLVKTIKMQRSHAQGICVILFVILRESRPKRKWERFSIIVISSSAT